MEVHMKANGLKTKKMVWESKLILMEQDMMVFGKMESVMALEDVYMLMAISMRATGFKMKCMALASKD